jgi:hypothetical protein
MAHHARKLLALIQFVAEVMNDRVTIAKKGNLNNVGVCQDVKLTAHVRLSVLDYCFVDKNLLCFIGNPASLASFTHSPAVHDEECDKLCR